MRTRRSPRNQAILWRALGGPPPPAPADASTVESLERQRAAATSDRTRRMIDREIAAAKIRRARQR